MPVASASRSVPCEECPFRSFHNVFRDFTRDELDFVSRFKAGELRVERGTTFLAQESTSEHLFTVLGGWAFRYKMLPDGRRQILNYALPGDFVGLQASVLNQMEHSVEALSDMVLCIFPRAKLWELHRGHPTLAFDLTWLAAREEQIIDENLLSVGRRSALERIAYLLLHLFTRAKQLGLGKGDTFQFPLTQQHVADTLGMSLVHANKTFQRLRRANVVRWDKNRVEILDGAALAQIAQYDVREPLQRPFI
ncbi:MAG: Crp/Fnr family transcriptional regulator [Bradyrhizobiaceae bacterium]|nr:Crp/Fnr family transcriptional regulator [Hyphomicrobiales bacterium]MBV9427305.1 Crp/Fnr family transcriptional regulator [Bradyrhizobiaceae bacterium]